ncbi:MAG: aspartate kinase [Crocinitomicaceae bacterium]|nr:aspartate kinase [Crocinitomicaceae bacterium]|tara:strand:+ start:46 stop:708 length:663 start_codon:yes stop_codon:yes gene_type:complete
MSSISKVTEDIINRSPFLREAMTEDLINISALARKIKPEIEKATNKEIKEGAIVMAIKRMSPGIYHKVDLKINNVIGGIGDFLVRSDLIDFTIENSETIQKSQANLIQFLQEDKDCFFTLCKGITETTYVMNAKYIDESRRFFANETIKAQNLNLSSITVKLPTTNIETYGVYYYILKHLAWEGINIVQVVSTANEFTAIVHSNDIDDAFKILMQLKRGS